MAGGRALSPATYIVNRPPVTWLTTDWTARRRRRRGGVLTAAGRPVPPSIDWHSPVCKCQCRRQTDSSSRLFPTAFPPVSELYTGRSDVAESVVTIKR